MTVYSGTKEFEGAPFVRANFKGAPASSALTAVITSRASTALTAAATRLRLGPHRHHDRLGVVVELDALNDRAR